MAAAAPSVRPARAADLPALLAIWRVMMRAHQQHDAAFALASDAAVRWQQMASEMLGRADTFVLVADGVAAARQPPAPCGFCLGWVARNPAIYRRAEVGFVSEIAVAPAARRQGVGRALLAAVHAWCTARGLEEFQLSTAVWNQDAQAFWRAVGGTPLLLRYRFDVAGTTGPH